MEVISTKGGLAGMDRQITTQIDSYQNVATVMPRKMDEAQMLRDIDYKLAEGNFIVLELGEIAC